MQKKEVEGIGTLYYEDDSFMGKIKVDIFSKIYEIDIRVRVFSAGYDGLSDDVIDVAKNCLNTLNYSKEAELAIKEYYDTIVFEQAEEDQCDYIRFDNENQLSQVMQPEEIYIMKLKKDVMVGIYFSCDWSDEGFAIKFDENGNIVEMGTGDIIY